MTAMTREEFRQRWESDSNGGMLSFNDVAECAIAWGVERHPKARPVQYVLWRVLRAAGTEDWEEFRDNWEKDNAKA